MNYYRNMTPEELAELHFYFVSHGNANAAVEVSQFREYYNKFVRVVKGRKVPIGTEGRVFWLKRYDNSKHGDPWGIYSSTRVGIKTADGSTHFTALDNVAIIAEGEE